MKRLTINDILNKDDVKTKIIEIPEWDGSVEIRSMTGEARDAYEESVFKRLDNGEYERDLSNARAKLIAACVYDLDGTRMFKSDAQIKALGSKSAIVLDRLFTECQNINAISQQDMDELEGKSEADQL